MSDILNRYLIPLPQLQHTKEVQRRPHPLTLGHVAQPLATKALDPSRIKKIQPGDPNLEQRNQRDIEEDRRQDQVEERCAILSRTEQ